MYTGPAYSHLTQPIALPNTHAAKHRPRITILALALACSLVLAACRQSDGAAAPPTTTTAPVTVAPTEVAAAVPTVAPTAESTAESSSTTPTADTLADLWPIAYVREGVLYMETGSEGSTALAVENCAEAACNISHLTWSPDGTQLLYYVDSYESGVPRRLRLAALDGTVQTVTERAAFIQPAGFAPDGRAIVYREDTDRYAEAGDGPARRIQEIFTVALNEDGALGTPELRGETDFGEGCGGGGRSESALAYEREGGFAYGYLSAITLWTPDDVMLYTDNCSTRGVSRFDLSTNTTLEPYGAGLRSLSLNAAGDRWVAIDEQNQVVLGTPSSLDMTPLALSIRPEMVFFGENTGQIYVTTLDPAGDRDLFDLVATLDQSIMLQPFADTTVAKLYRVNPDSGEATQLYGEDGYAYARVAEVRADDVIVSRVEDNSELVTALENGDVSAENWRTYLPSVDVLLLGQEDALASTLMLDAAQFTAGHTQ